MKKQGSAIGIGAITVLNILLVIMLSIFSALTLSSARADMALSQRSADSVTAYYAADAEAVRLYREFSESSEPELETDISASDTQTLHLHFARTADGEAKILAWQLVPAAQDTDSLFLDVWDGGLFE